MEAIILAGGFGSRLSEETGLKPKPMIEIGNLPILVHIINYLNSFGINKFVICLGYKGDYIKEYFFKKLYTNGNIEINMNTKEIKPLDEKKEKYTIRFIETGYKNMTGSRLRQAIEHIDGENFLMTYGDGLTNQNIKFLFESHLESKKIATITAVRKPGRFGELKLKKSNNKSQKNNIVEAFSEKPIQLNTWINGGYFMLNKKVKKFLNNKSDLVWEEEPLKKLAKENQLNAFIHEGFWHPMDTLKDKRYLESLVKNKNAPWLKY